MERAGGDPDLNLDDADGDGYDTCDDDCDDADADVYPGQGEDCGNGVDDDCDGNVDECGPTGTIDLALADASIFGEAAEDWAGISIALVGDTDGDGTDDVLIGARQEDQGGTTAGAAYLLNGPLYGGISLSNADAKFVGEEAIDLAGQDVNGAGDVNDDGLADLLIGATFAGAGGKAYIFYGPVAGQHDLSAADAILEGESGTAAGNGLSGGGDIDGDGVDDVVIGARLDSELYVQAGAAYIVYGPISGTTNLASADAKLRGQSTNDLAGYAVTIAGDVNADGNDDVLVAAQWNDEGGTEAGAVYLLHGPQYGTVELGSADAKFVGENAGDEAGMSLGQAGDIDGDGYADVLVGAALHNGVASDAGAGYLCYGPVSGTVDLSTADARFDGEAASDSAGGWTVGAGDVDGDGYGDILVSARGSDLAVSNAGAVYLLYGPFSGAYDLGAADATFLGEAASDIMGACSPMAGDVDGDGHPDLLMAAYLNDTGATDAGTTYLVYGVSP